jgi:hypothetical protein
VLPLAKPCWFLPFPGEKDEQNERAKDQAIVPDLATFADG